MKRQVVFLGAALAVAGVTWLATRNHTPEAANDSATVGEGESVSIDVLGNDSDPDKEPLSILAVGQPQHGTALVSEDRQRIIYTPASGFYGSESFDYRVADPQQATATASVTVETTFVPPKFHLRSSSATLSEMVQEPPTSVYGSTINVFLYRDQNGQLREITVAGHADSMTCREASGAFASALINADIGNTDFLLAGAGRLSLPAADPARSEQLERDEDVDAYTKLSGVLATVRQLLHNGSITQKIAEKAMGMTFTEAQREIEALEKTPAVIEYRQQFRPGERAAYFLRQASELQEKSGMLQLHEVPFDVIAKVRERVEAAAAAEDSRVVRFDDLLATGQEAVVYTPIMRFRQGGDLVLEVALNDFSPAGFVETAKLHRSALEQAIVGTARQRLKHAVEFLKRATDDKAECVRMSDSDLDRRLPGVSSCTKEGCEPDMSGRTITYRQYCSVNVPDNLTSGQEWKEEAEGILNRVNQLREQKNEDRIDALTHATLVDSMLRDWALPVPDAQPAFDRWRTVGRGPAWQAVSEALAAQGVARAALSGESIVFNVSMAGQRLVIRPLMAIDLKRTAVLVDPALGATAAVSAWEFRQMRPVATLDAGNTMVADALRQPAQLVPHLSAQPGAAISALLDAARSARPEEPEFWKARAEAAGRAQAHSIEDPLLDSVKEADKMPLTTTEEAWRYLLAIHGPIHIVRHTPNIAPLFRLRVAAAAARGLAALGGASTKEGWSYLRQVTSAPANTMQNSQLSGLLFGETSDQLLRGIVASARRDNAAMVDAALAASSLPAVPNSGAGNIEAEPILTTIIGRVEMARSALQLRGRLDHALKAFDSEGRAAFSELFAALNAPEALADLRFGNLVGELLLNLRVVERQTAGSRTGPIEGTEIMKSMIDLREAINRALVELEPTLAEFRFGRDQDTIVTRLLFDQGQYALALDRLAPKTVPLSLYAPTLTWTPLNVTLRGKPKALSMREEGERMIVTATLPGGPKDVLSLNNLDQEARKDLLTAQPLQTSQLNEGDLLWEQILLTEVAAPRVLSQLRSMLTNEAVRPWALKALVYACAVPGEDMLKSDSGRCGTADGSTVLHDRVQQSGGAEFVAPAAVSDSQTRGRFLEPLAWRPQIAKQDGQ